jgi:hypothetical protein
MVTTKAPLSNAQLAAKLTVDIIFQGLNTFLSLEALRAHDYFWLAITNGFVILTTYCVYHDLKDWKHPS